MDKIVVEGGRPLTGTVTISGSKNAALPILAASLLSDEECVIRGVPNLRDVDTLLRILRELGVDRAAPTHCSGDRARELFAAAFGENYIPSGVGAVVTIEP